MQNISHLQCNGSFCLKWKTDTLWVNTLDKYMWLCARLVGSPIVSFIDWGIWTGQKHLRGDMAWLLVKAKCLIDQQNKFFLWIWLFAFRVSDPGLRDRMHFIWLAAISITCPFPCNLWPILYQNISVLSCCCHACATGKLYSLVFANAPFWTSR